MVAVKPDVSDARRRDESQNALDHAESGAQNGDERELLAADLISSRLLERRLHGHRLEREVAVASYAMSIAISSTSSLKIFVGVRRSRSSVSLCCTSGCARASSSRTQGWWPWRGSY